ncbi:MAG: hypothetical protein Q8P20_02850 [bacterium]|nr:hypothetical protein [bacterium]
MKINVDFDKYKEIIKKYIFYVVYIILVIIFGLTSYFTYLKVYKIAIAPDKIQESEIIAKKQKVNIELFNEIQNEIVQKNDKSIKNIKNPFIN